MISSPNVYHIDAASNDELELLEMDIDMNGDMEMEMDMDMDADMEEELEDADCKLIHHHVLATRLGTMQQYSKAATPSGRSRSAEGDEEGVRCRLRGRIW